MPASTSSFIATLDGYERLTDTEVVELWSVLSTVPDPRDRRGVRHAFATVLTLAVAAVLAGSRSVAAIAAWAADVPVRQYRPLGVGRAVPALSTFARVMARVDPDVLDAVLSAWLAARAGVQEGLRAVALDGKTARGAVRPDGTRVHLVGLLEHTTGQVSGQVEVESKGSEIGAFITVLDRLDLHGYVVTADALHTQRAHARYLRRHGGHYLFTVKGNQPGLHTTCSQLPWSQVPIAHVEHDVGHGRSEQRLIQVIAEVHPRVPFPHARQVARLQRRRRAGRTGAWRTQVVFLITDLTAERADPARLMQLARGHWGIENRVHWVRDVTFDEDRHTLRTGHAATVMATFRNTAITLLRQARYPNIAAATAAMARRPDRILDLIDRRPAGGTSQPSRL